MSMDEWSPACPKLSRRVSLSEDGREHDDEPQAGEQVGQPNFLDFQQIDADADDKQAAAGRDLGNHHVREILLEESGTDGHGTLVEEDRDEGKEDAGAV